MSFKPKDNVGEEKLEDILRSIRGIIDNHNNSATDIPDKDIAANLEDSILELTTEFKENEDDEDELLSPGIAEKFSTTMKDFTNKVNEHVLSQQETVDINVTKLIKPMLKEWLDNNLPRIVEKIITEELKKLIPPK